MSYYIHFDKKLMVLHRDELCVYTVEQIDDIYSKNPDETIVIIKQQGYFVDTYELISRECLEEFLHEN